MALVLADRVNETTTTTGTGTVTLAGAVSGYQSFTVIGNGNTTYYTIVHQTLSEWEVGIGTYTASGTTLSRDTILASSNSGSAVNFSAGTKFVFCDYPAGRAVYLDSSTNVTVPQITLSSGTANGVLYLNGSKVATSGGNLTYDGTTLFAQYLNLNQWYSYNDNDRDANSSTYLPTASARSFRYAFVNASSAGTGGNYAGLLQFNPWTGTTSSTGDASYQLFFGSTAINGGGFPWLRIRKGIDSTWNTGYNIPLYDANTSYASALYSTIVYDANNTGYYLDPAGSSQLSFTTFTNSNDNQITLNGGGTSWAGIQFVDVSNNDFIWYNGGGSTFAIGGGGSNVSNKKLHVNGGTTIGSGLAGTAVSTNGLLVETRVDAPVFYDSNNTGYYMDPSAGGNVQGNWEFSSTDNSSTSYSVAAIELRESNQGGSGSYLAPRLAFHWGGVVASQIGIESGGRISILDNPGSGYQDLIGNILYGSASVRAPIFYDSDNTGYYLDPASTSRLNLVAGTLMGAVSGAPDSTIWCISGDYQNWGIFYNEDSPDFIEFRYAGTTSSAIGLDGGGMRSSIFYDINNTAYYVDPASTSVLNILNIPGQQTINTTTPGTTNYNLNFIGQSISDYAQAITWSWSNTGAQAGIYVQSSGGYGTRMFLATTDSFATGSKTALYISENGVVQTLRNYFEAVGSSRAPLFYDSGNTAYYVDPAASTSANFYGSVNAATYNLAGLLVNASGTSSSGGAIAIQQGTAEGWTGIFCDYEPYTGWGLWHDNPNNYFSFTSESSTGSIRSFSVPSRVSGLRTAYEKFRVDQGSGDTITGAIGYANASFRAPIFYDSNDTNYYVDPASFTNLNAVNATRIGVNPSGSSSNGYGISLYGGYTAAEPTYGLMFQGTSTFGTYGSVSGDWATYFTMNNDPARGWIFRNVSTGNVAGISNAGQMTLASHLEQGNNLGRPNVSWSASSTSTGMVIFYLPGTTSNYGMVHMVFDIYEYDSPRVATVIIGGHNWSTSWYNVGCNVVGYTDKQVRLGVKDGRFCVVFGTSGSSWQYGTIVLRKIHNAGFYDNVMNMTGDWSSTQTTTESFTNITGDLRGLRTPSTMQVDGILYGYNSIRSNIFYDNDNTGYYGDFASTSNVNAMVSYSYQGNGNVGGTGSASWHPSGIYSAGYNWLYGGINGGGASGTNFSDLRATIFYDYNDTGYYVDPASGTNLAGTLTNTGNITLTNGANRYVRIGSATNYSYDLQTTNDNFQIIEAGTTPRLTITYPTGAITASTDFRAPIFYDSNNTAYYVDAASTSNLNSVVWATTGSGGITIGNGTATEVDVAYSSSGGTWEVGFNNYYGTNSWFWYRGGTGYRGGLDQSANMFIEGSSRAPIFYDYNNTAYYLDPASTSELNKVYYNSNMVSRNYGIGQVGLYASTRLQAVFAMGESYLLSADGTSAGNLYGIAWSYPSAGGVAANLASHGMLILENGAFKGAWGGGSLRTTSDVRGTLFYDWDNTNYYVDPAGTTQLSYVLADNWFRPQGDTGLYFQSYGYGLRSAHGEGNSYGNATTYATGRNGWSGWGIGNRLCFMSDIPGTGGSGSTTGLHDNTYGWIWRWINESYFTVDRGYSVFNSSARAPIFYDSNDTGYYADLNATAYDSIRAAGNIVAYYSDERLKTHLGKIENALEKVDQLEGFYYEANEVAQKLGYKAKREVGVSAQAVQRVLPEIVTDAPISANYLTINYERLVPLLIEAIKELKGEVETLKSRLH